MHAFVIQNEKGALTLSDLRSVAPMRLIVVVTQIQTSIGDKLEAGERVRRASGAAEDRSRHLAIASGDTIDSALHMMKAGHGDVETVAVCAGAPLREAAVRQLQSQWPNAVKLHAVSDARMTLYAVRGQ
jgi:hypothetical protein